MIDGLESSDVTVGSRLIEKTTYGFSKPRRLAISTLSVLLRLISGKKIHDPTSGFRGSNKKAIRIFSEHYPSEYLGDTVISLLVASRFKLRISEISTEMKLRQGGQPSQKAIKSSFLLMRVILVLILSRFRKLEN